MPSTASGRISKARRANKSTPHQKNHRWESFTAKISQLHSLDPLRKVRRHDLDAEDLSTTTSYLRNGVEKWADLNISKSFASFKREILPLCDSLPQILHFEDKIMDLLASYISLQEKEALEALLDLLTAFAHDLGVRFEKHYARSLQLILITSGHQDVEVIEWTFAALAFLFKYLSRLLVPDLRPTYDALAPLLGKSKQPGHIARFAAEAMSFLVKRVAVPMNREKALPLLVEHARDDLLSTCGSKQFGLYYHGLLTMFAEAIKSPGNTIHSTGPDIFRALLRSIPDPEYVPGGITTWMDLCCGVLTSIVHHSTADTFKGMIAAILDEATLSVKDQRSIDNPWRLSVCVRLIGTISGVRGGSRVGDWPAVVQVLSVILESMSEFPDITSQRDAAEFWQHIAVNAAITWSQASMDSLIPAISGLMNALTREPLTRWYISFCAYFFQLNPERFQSLFLKHFQRFIASHWSEGSNEDQLCIIFPRLVTSGGFSNGKANESCPLPHSWQDHIVHKFEQLEITPFPERGAYDKDPKTWRDKCLPKYSAMLQVLEATSVDSETQSRIAELLLRKLKLALRPSTSAVTDETLFIVTQGFRAYLGMSKEVASIDLSLGPLLRAAAPRFSRLPRFLEGLRTYEQLSRSGQRDSQSSNGSESSQRDESPLVKSLITNLSAPSHQLRLISLQILDLLEFTPDHNSILASMIQTEETPFDLQNSRTVASYLRKLAPSYAGLPEGSWLHEALPSFLFGLLTVPLSPLWDDAVEALKQIAESKSGEEPISSLSFDWLEVASPRWSGLSKPTMVSSHQPLTDFECLNLVKLQNLSKETERVWMDPSGVMLQAFQESQEIVPAHAPNARSKALKVLSAVPALAEKRSRRLVPFLLTWTSDQDTSRDDEGEDGDVSRAESWSLADRKALMGVFAQFTNPKALYQNEKVYDALLQLMANGDVEIQKLSLRAILAWKQEEIKAYKETLEALLDDSRFKNELTLLFQDDHRIQLDHRPILMPVLLRLLYGRTISKKGAASGRHGLQATRLAVIRNLNVGDAGAFLQIALGPLGDVQVADASGVRECIFSKEILPARKQVGLLNMLEAIVNELGTNVSPYTDSLVNAILYCLISACQGLQGSFEENENREEKSNTSLLRVARTTSLKCLCALFKNANGFDWNPYKGVIVAEVVSPTIEKMPHETTQGISWTLRLLSTWSLIPKAALILAIDGRILPKIIECVAVEKSKDEVKVFALGIVRNLVRLSQSLASEVEGDELIKSELLDPHIDGILRTIDGVLRGQHDIGRNLLEACVDTVVEVSPLIGASENIRNLVDISTFLLNQPSRKVNPKVKGSILLILERFIVLDDLQNDVVLKQKVLDTLSSLFSFFKDRENRQSLSRVLLVFASQEPQIQEVADLCADLNSYVEGRLDQPDYDRRLLAFNAISKQREIPLTIDQWVPLLQNMVFFIRQDEEFGILSSNSADCICKFIEATASPVEQSAQEVFIVVLANIVLPTIYSAARDESQTVRREILRVLGFLASNFNSWAPVADLALLAPANDQDSERLFFANILSLQTSRQIQALQLLEGANERSEFSSKNISQFFIPLLEHFILGREDGSDDRGLGAQATNAIAGLSGSLEWPQYRAVLRRFLSFAESKPSLQKQVIRLLDKVIDSLAVASQQSCCDTTNLFQPDIIAKKRRLASTLPSQEKVSDEVLKNFLPSLLTYLHERDESTVSARVPVGIIVVKLLNVLPPETRDLKLGGVLTDICQILRSKAWESREMARDTLAKISYILPPTYFGFMLKELRAALSRGSQLHVVSYTMHSLLLAVIPKYKQGDLDYCVPTMVAVVMDDVFGVTGQEKDAEDYVSKMKEVKSSKSQDSIELISKNISISHLGELIQPLQALLMEKLDRRIVSKIDTLLSRISSGLLQNPAAGSRDTLVFCYEVIKDVYNRKEKPETEKVDPKLRRYLYQKGASKTGGSTARALYKLVGFALDVLRAVLRKHDSLRNAANIQGFLPILGDQLVSGEEEVKIATFKLLTVLVKVPFKTNELTDLYKVAAKEATKAIGMSVSTSTDLAQSALKLMSVILRDRREVTIRDAAIDVLLGKLKDDLTNPLYRHVTFNFLRSVLDRKIETAAVYDTLDYVGTVMITNDDQSCRDLARGAFHQFLREYPQKKSRWQKQLTFIVANLKYDREGGRLSVMEVILLLLKKSADDFAQEVVATCFIPLVFVLANDDSDKCRLAAGELIKEIFRKANKENTRNFLKLLRSWIEQDEKPAVLKLALQAFGFYFQVREAGTENRDDLNLLIATVDDILENATEDWELVNTAVLTAQSLVEKFPSRMLSSDAETDDLWERIQGCLTHSSATVRLSAIRLLGVYLADFASNGSAVPHSLKGSYGLGLDNDDMQRLVKLCLGIFRAVEVEEALAEEAARILIFLGGHLNAGTKNDGLLGQEEDEEAEDFVDVTLQYLFGKLAAIARKETPPKASYLVPKLACMAVLEAFCKKTSKDSIQPTIKTILRPLRNLTDQSIPTPFSADPDFRPKYDALKSKAQAIMDVLCKKFGTAQYTKYLLAVGEEIKGRRQGRSSKRKIEAVTQPEKHGRDKRKKFEKKKERRKIKGQEHRSRRRGY